MYGHAYVCVWQIHAYLVYVKIIMGLFKRQWQKRYLSCSLDFLHNLYFTVAQSFLRGWKREALFVNCTSKDHAPQKIPKIESCFGLGFVIPDAGRPQWPIPRSIGNSRTLPSNQQWRSFRFSSYSWESISDHAPYRRIKPRHWYCSLNMLSSQWIK